MRTSAVVALIVLTAALLGPRILRIWNNEFYSAKSAGTAAVRNVARELSVLAFPRTKPLARKLKVAIGYNSNLDLIVPNSTEMLQAMLDNSTSVAAEQLQPRDHETIQTESHLWESFLYWFNTGTASERFVFDQELFDSLVKRSEQHLGLTENGDSSQDGSSGNTVHERQHSENEGYFIGGNAALMSTRFFGAGFDVLLGGALGPQLRSLLLEGSFADNNGTLSFASDDARDEVHLIFEYARDSEMRVGSSDKKLVYRSNRANRYILSSDFTNAEFRSAKIFHEQLDSFSPDLVIVSGFHLLDGMRDDIERMQKLRSIAALLSASSEKARAAGSPPQFIHIELASVGNKNIYREVADIIFPHVTSIGLNEQELQAIRTVLNPSATPFEQIAQPVPNLDQVRQTITMLFEMYPTIERVHFHSLSFHLVTQRSNSHRSATNDLRAMYAAVTGSSLAAAQRACGFKKPGNVIEQSSLFEQRFHVQEQRNTLASAGNAEMSDLTIVKQVLLTWTQPQHALRFAVAPVLICKRIVKTVGLGDLISSSGLVHQLQSLATLQQENNADPL